MQKSNFESLQSLILSLSQGERDALMKRFALRSNHKEENRLFTLFNLIQKDKTPDGERIFNIWRRKIKADVTENAYEKAKSQLKQFILETLRLMDVPGRDAYLLERLDFASILAARGLHAEAYKMLQLTDKDALEFTDPFFACIINYKMIQFLPHIPEKDRAANVQELMHNTGAMVEQLQTYHAIFSFNLEVALLARQTSVLKTKKQTAQLKILSAHPVIKLKIKDLPYVAQCTLLKSLSWLYRIAGELQSAYTFQKELVELFRSKEHYNMQNRPKQYLAEWADLINISIKLNLKEEAAHALAVYEDICEKYHIADVHSLLVLKNYTLIIQLLGRENPVSKEILHSQWKLINTAAKKIQAGHLLVFILTVMKCFLAEKDHKKLHDAYILILKSSPAERFDVLFTAELLYTLSIYEQSRFNATMQVVELSTHLANQAQSLQRRMTTAGDKHDIDNSIVRCIKNLSEKYTISDHIAVLHKLNKVLLQKKQDLRNQSVILPVFDMLFWTMQQINILESVYIKKGGKKMRRPVSKVS